MLRRVTRTLRVLLAVAGIVVLVWLPVSCGYGALAAAHVAAGEIGVFSCDGLAEARCVTEDPLYEEPKARVFRLRQDPTQGVVVYHFTDFLWPKVSLIGGFVTFPLWLLSLLCLAWPVTSFLLARRKRRRGFEVEPATGGNPNDLNQNDESMTNDQ